MEKSIAMMGLNPAIKRSNPSTCWLACCWMPLLLSLPLLVLHLQVKDCSPEAWRTTG